MQTWLPSAIRPGTSWCSTARRAACKLGQRPDRVFATVPTVEGTRLPQPWRRHRVARRRLRSSEQSFFVPSTEECGFGSSIEPAGPCAGQATRRRATEAQRHRRATAIDMDTGAVRWRNPAISGSGGALITAVGSCSPAFGRFAVPSVQRPATAVACGYWLKRICRGEQPTWSPAALPKRGGSPAKGRNGHARDIQECRGRRGCRKRRRCALYG